jgi:hypothetical protein
MVCISGSGGKIKNFIFIINVPNKALCVTHKETSVKVSITTST